MNCHERTERLTSPREGPHRRRTAKVRKREMCRLNIRKNVDSNEGARLLHISRPYLDALVRSGELTVARITPDGRQWFSSAVLLAYKERLRARQRKGMKTMMEATRRTGLYEAELDGLPTRVTTAPSK
jgi:hypothetical protein